MFKSLLQIAFLYLLLLVISVGAAVFFFVSGNPLWGYFCIVAVAVAFYAVMTTYTRFNRRLNFMLLSLQNDDHSFRFPENLNSKAEKTFNSTLNKIRDLLQKARLATIEQERYYELILNDIKTGIVAIDHRGHVYQHNQAALRMLGLSVFTHINQLEKINTSFPETFALLKTGDRQRISYANERGTVHLVINVAEILFQNRILRVLAINDIESELGEKEMESWVRLVRVLTHEIMNSVAPITSMSETLLNHCRKQKSDSVSETMITGLEAINETGKGLISFVESYRKFTGIRQPEKYFFPVKPLLERIMQLMQMEHDCGHAEMLLIVKPADLQLFADERQITQVLVNLIKNALQAIGDKPGGRVSLCAGQDDTGKIFIEVRDNGSGIPPELVEDIFVPFFTTKEKGSGVGLSVSRYIMRLHNGNLHLQNTGNKETVFVMMF